MVVLALCVSMTVLLLGVLEGTRSPGDTVGLALMFFGTGIVGLFFALGGLACSFWWPAAAPYLSGVSIGAVVGPWIILGVISVVFG